MEYLNRRSTALARLAERGADALLVTRLTHIRYLTGFTGTAGMLLLAGDPDRTVLVVDFRYGAQAREQAAGVRVNGDCAPPRLWATVGDELAGLAPASLGVDTRNLTAEQYLDLAGRDTRKLVPCDGLLERLRQIKDSDELAALREAADLAEELVRRLPEWLAPGRTENEVAGEIERAQRKLGAERSAAPLIVASGERTTLPHGAASGRTMRAGEPVLVDLSPVVRGYRADITRTFHLGPAPAAYRRLHAAVTEAHGRAMAAVRAGVRARDVDAIARQVLAEHELDQYFRHSLGHSIGLDQHEPPLLSPYDDTVLAAGMVVMIEPGVYVPGIGGTRIEDAVLVTESGATPLTTSDPSIREL
jgi:Xaa-Pro aminopeptidase